MVPTYQIAVKLVRVSYKAHTFIMEWEVRVVAQREGEGAAVGIPDSGLPPLSALICHKDLQALKGIIDKISLGLNEKMYVKE